MLRMRIQVDGLTKTISNLRNVRRKLGDHRDFLRTRVTKELSAEFKKCFNTRGYGSWRPLDRDTILEKQEEGFSSQALVRTNRYRRACEELRGMSIRRSSGRSRLRIKSPVPYARYHEFGTRDIPARPVFELVANEMQRKIVRIYRQYLERRLRRELS